MSEQGAGRGSKELVVGGRYRLLERVGSGGMGTVWRAHDELVEREVAVKQPRLPGEPEDEAFRRAAHRLHREARAAARVDHPSAVSIHDVVVEEDGLPWIVMELVRGESLHETLRRGPVEPAETARIGLAVLGALRAAHSVGIVHRDVKPANVLLGAHGRVVLTDFGIAHVQGEESLTATGEFVGSLEFVAPERMSGRTAGPASDLWSLGVLLYAAVEGWSPFRRTTVESTLAAILSADPPEPERAGPLAPLLSGLLAKDPGQRPDAEETAAALAAAATGEHEKPDEPTAPGPKPPGAPGDSGSSGRSVAPGAPEAPRRPDGPATGDAPQDVSGLLEFGDDIRTTRLAPDPDTTAAPTPPAPTPPESIPAVRPPAATAAPTPPRRRLHRRPLPLAFLGALLVAAAWTGIALLADPDSGAVTGTTASHSSAEPAPAPTSRPSATPGWSAHPERAMGATLALPDTYEEFARQGSDSYQPRAVEYAAGSVQVRLTQWDEAPGTPMSQAKQHAATWEFFEEPRTQYTRTTFRGWEAVQSDTTYGEPELRRRVMELFVRTDDGRLYELRVEMPKGTAEEKRGTAVFKSARDRLTIATTP
ncbi:serine/threonine-protein kinase [Streptomyces sp. NPDC058867]|uniref:serine/threonine-protein kinase n=1 Tax=unclassified Streptomyces TaxID=2593676 RepID=UPI003683A076